MTPWIEAYLRDLELRNFSPATIESHRGHLKTFLVFAVERGIFEVERIHTGDVKAFQVRLFEQGAHGRPLQVKSQNNVLKVVRRFLRFLFDEGGIARDPWAGLRYAKEPRRLPASVAGPDEVARLLACAGGLDPVSVRDRLLLEIIYGSALRRNELRNLRLDDLDIEGRALRVVCGKGRKDRVVPMTRVCCRWLARYLSHARPRLCKKADYGYLFVGRSGPQMGRCTPGLVVKRAARAAGLSRRLYPHALRAACATHMMRHNAHPRHLMELLGHADLTSLHRYTAVEIAELKAVHAKTHPRELEGAA